MGIYFEEGDSFGESTEVGFCSEGDKRRQPPPEMQNTTEVDSPKELPDSK